MGLCRRYSAKKQEEPVVKTTTSFALILLAALVLGGAALESTASDATLDRDGTWIPDAVLQPLGGPADSRTLINDGSFELGPPPASAWTEENNSSCERIGDFSGEWYVSAYDGVFDYWAGGYCVNDTSGMPEPVISSVTQVVTVPADETTLSFYYIAFRPDPDDDPPDGDRAYVSVDGVEVWTLDFIRANNTYPFWEGPVTVDLSPFAGQSISLCFGGIPVGEVTGNARFDYIEFIEGQTPTMSTTWGEVKSVYR
jgi:hypothetical protein